MSYHYFHPDEARLRCDECQEGREFSCGGFEPLPGGTEARREAKEEGWVRRRVPWVEGARQYRIGSKARYMYVDLCPECAANREVTHDPH